jgi:hypothetical protein
MIVKGIILNENNLPFADVNCKTAFGSTRTNQYGEFTITIPGPATILEFTHVGYDFDNVPASYFDKESSLQLFTSKQTLEEIVLTNPKKEDNTMLWILGIVALSVTAYAISNKKPSTIKKPSLRKPRIQPTKVIM